LNSYVDETILYAVVSTLVCVRKGVCGTENGCFASEKILASRLATSKMHVLNEEEYDELVRIQQIANNVQLPRTCIYVLGGGKYMTARIIFKGKR
jgi:Flp pilus assembly secretin CpaC